MKTNPDYKELIDHLFDLKEQSERYYRHMESAFLNEEEQMAALVHFKPSNLIRYDGGYPQATKKKVIFQSDAEDDFSDIVVLEAKIDQRFVTISHRDILGALMSLQIDRSSFGDFFVQDDYIYIYTSASMARYLMDQLTSIHHLNVQFSLSDKRPEKEIHVKRLEVNLASLRLDAIVSALANVSRKQASEMIQKERVQVNHVTLVDSAVLCHNNSTISIRGVGRFEFKQVLKTTRKNRLVAEFLQSV